MRRTVSVLAAAGLVLGLAACGGGDDEPDAAPSSTGASSASPTGEPSAEPSETEPAFDGRRETVESVSVMVPKGWQGEAIASGDVATFSNPDPTNLSESILIGGYVTTETDKPLDQLVRESTEGIGLTKVKRLDDLTGPGGVEMAHIRGEFIPGRVMDVVTGIASGGVFEVRIETDLPAKDHEALVESIVPTIEFP